jgi:hypothetical protein
MYHHRTARTLLALLACLAGTASAVRFTDPFIADPAAPDHEPCMWDLSSATADPAASWSIVDGALEYRTENGQLEGAILPVSRSRLLINDASNWSLETAFRHLAGTPPSAAYEAVLYITWRSDTPGRVRDLTLMYDAGAKELLLCNGARKEAIPADLTGAFHTLRLTVSGGRLRLYLDGQACAGPAPLESIAYETNEMIMLGPVTQTANHTLRCQWDYLAFTDEGAFAPGEGNWNPARETTPRAAKAGDGKLPVSLAGVFDHPPYPGLKLLRREPGSASFDAALPEHVRRWNEVCADRPSPMDVSLYHYPGETGPTLQNVYRGCFPAQTDPEHSVAALFLTRGINDTVAGTRDYKMWYCVSTDGGRTYGPERPIVQRGAGYSPEHPIEYVWVGKNGFVFATLQPFLLPLSNGQVFLPCCYDPVDDQGREYNPYNTSLYSRVCGLIGTWNETRTDVTWDVTAPITVSPEVCPGGLSECAVIELAGPPGRIFMVMRGSNEGDRTGTMPSWKWQTLSSDYGRTWSPPEPFTFSDGSRFLSPAAQSNLIRSSRTGKVYWIGNISRALPWAGGPRYPLVIAELDEQRLGLRKETVTLLDDRGPADRSDLQLSNFSFLEDATTGHFIVTLNRLRGGPGANGQHTYVIGVQ